MPDLQDFAVVVAEVDWGNAAWQSAKVVGLLTGFYLLHVRIGPAQDNTGHDYVFGSDTLQQAGSDATSTSLRSSSTTHIPTATVTKTVTATADPDKVASSLANKLLPVLDSRFASLKEEVVAMQARYTLFMMIGLLLLFLLTTAFWYFLMYKPVYKALKEERDRNTGGRLRYNHIRTTLDRPPVSEDPHSTRELVHGERPNGNDSLTIEQNIKTETIDLTPVAPQESDTDSVLADVEHRKDSGSPLDQPNAGSDTVDSASATGEPVVEELANTTHDEVPPTVASPLLQSPPLVEAIIPQTHQKQSASTTPISTVTSTTTTEPSGADTVIMQQHPNHADEQKAVIVPINESQESSAPAQPELSNQTTVSVLLSEGPQDHKKEALPNQPIPKPEDFKVPSFVFTRCNVQGLGDRAQLMRLLGAYFTWIKEQFLCRISSSGNQQAYDEIKAGCDKICSWIDAGEDKDGIFHAKTVTQRRKRLENQLHQHFLTVLAPTNSATLRNHKTKYQPLMAMLRNSEQARAQYDELNEQLTALENKMPTLPISLFDLALQQSINAMEAAKARAAASISSA